MERHSLEKHDADRNIHNYKGTEGRLSLPWQPKHRWLARLGYTEQVRL